jgi:hypothetical protein
MTTSSQNARSTQLDVHRESLLLETSLAASCLGNGLTEIRRYSFADKGRFFAGMFGVSVGLERILKVCVVLEHLLRTDAPPNEEQLRGFGHRLSALLRVARELNKRHALGVDEAPLSESLTDRIVVLLTAFAKETRYYNLNLVTGAQSSSSAEPLAAWARDIDAEIVKRHYRLSRARRTNLAIATALNNTPGIVVAHTADDGTPIEDFANFVAESALAETKRKYSVFYIHRIALFCIGILEGLDQRFNPRLYVGEPFRYLDIRERAAILRRRRWDRTD